MKCCVIKFELMLMKLNKPYNEFENFKYLDSLHFCVLRNCPHFFLSIYRGDVVVNKLPLQEIMTFFTKNFGKTKVHMVFLPPCPT